MQVKSKRRVKFVKDKFNPMTRKNQVKFSENDFGLLKTVVKGKN